MINYFDSRENGSQGEISDVKIFSMKALKATLLANKEIYGNYEIFARHSTSAVCNVHFSRDCRMSSTLARDSRLGLLETHKNAQRCSM